jgi:3-hydroxyisobutyrate dehydrogenase
MAWIARFLLNPPQGYLIIAAMTNVAFLGTGLLGSAMVEGMVRRGDAVTVWNRTEAKARALEQLGATVAATVGDAVAAADHVHMTLPDDAVVDEIMASVTPRLRPGALVVDHSTTSPRGTKARLEKMQAAGVKFLHAPVFMSPQMARDGVGIMLASGPQAVFDEALDDLEGMTGQVWYLGEQGDLAAAYKIFGNSMIFVIAAGITDVFAMAKGLGIQPSDALAVFSKFQPGGMITSRGEKMARGDFNASFELTMARKDMRLMLEAAGNQPMTVLPAIAKRMDEAIAKGHGHEDLGAIAAELVR